MVIFENVGNFPQERDTKVRAVAKQALLQASLPPICVPSGRQESSNFHIHAHVVSIIAVHIVSITVHVVSTRCES